ncbi:MAG: class I SAM-dependent methyltransferase [Candidatus Aenigmarchaeota archaeon]|nr:class I SAM-dependent methyltransferase [Candidatus Aenigmarchaeota archaeon]
MVGCAYGFEVEGFRALGIDAHGIDVSEFAISQAKSELQPYLEVADARVKMGTYKRNEWDFIFSRWFLECMSDVDLAALIPEMNTACKSDQVHIVNTEMRADYYNVKSLLDWADLPFAVGTILIPNDNFDEYLTVIN